MTIMYSHRIRRVKGEMYWFGEKRVFFALALESSPLIWIYLQAGSVWWGIPAQKSWKDFLTCPLRTNAHSTQPTFLLRIFATCLSPSHKSNSHPLQYISHRRQTFHFSFDFHITLLLQASINNSLPPVAYTKAIDVWTGVKILFLWRKHSEENIWLLVDSRSASSLSSLLSWSTLLSTMLPVQMHRSHIPIELKIPVSLFFL